MQDYVDNVINELRPIVKNEIIPVYVSRTYEQMFNEVLNRYLRQHMEWYFDNIRKIKRNLVKHKIYTFDGKIGKGFFGVNAVYLGKYKEEHDRYFS